MHFHHAEVERESWQDKIQKFAHPIKFGRDPKLIFQEKRTNNLILQSNNKMRWKRRMSSGVFLEALSIDIMFKNDQAKFVPQESSFPFQLKYIDVLRRTNSTLDLLLQHKMDGCWTVDGHQHLSGPWTVSPTSRY